MIDFKNAFFNPHLWECSPVDAYSNHPHKYCREMHYGIPWLPGDPDEWPVWVDALGRTFKAGDTVAISGLSGRSAMLIVGRVVRINRKKRNGDHIYSTGSYYGNYQTSDGHLPHGMRVNDPAAPPRVHIPSATVTATPIHYPGREYYSYRPEPKEKPRDNTYTNIDNILLLPPNEAKLVPVPKWELNTP